MDRSRVLRPDESWALLDETLQDAVITAMRRSVYVHYLEAFNLA
jgi:hypothetical protein